MNKLSIIIPVYNEEKTVHLILNKIKNITLPHNIEKEIIIINDYSSDDTSQSIQKYISDHLELNIIFLEHTKNQGKGAALHTGIAKATGEFTIIHDADLEYDPKEYSILLQPVLDGFADVVYGSRFMGGNAHRVLFFLAYDWKSLFDFFIKYVYQFELDRYGNVIQIV